MPTRKIVELPPMIALPEPSGINDGCKTFFSEYREARNEGKAYVIASGGHCTYNMTSRTAQDAAQHALDRCNARWLECKVYAEGYHIVP